MKPLLHLSLLSFMAVLSSCVYYTPTVPDMPYSTTGAGAAPLRQYPDTWVTQPPVAAPVPTQVPMAAPIPAPRVDVPVAAGGAGVSTLPVKPVVSPSHTITTPQNGVLTAPTTPAPKPVVKQPATMAERLATDPKSITNQGPIPVATRVEGDPTRVYNPLDPSKTIRVVDKNGKPYPSGKELKVRGTNFHFYVP